MQRARGQEEVVWTVHPKKLTPGAFQDLLTNSLDGGETSEKVVARVLN